MVWFWLGLIILGCIGYLAYKLGLGKELVNRILRIDSRAQVVQLEEKAKKLEEEADVAEKLRAVKARIAKAQTRISNARR